MNEAVCRSRPATWARQSAAGEPTGPTAAPADGASVAIPASTAVAVSSGTSAHAECFAAQAHAPAGRVGRVEIVQIPFESSRGSSLGIEWELELVDLETRQLRSGANEILAEMSPGGVEHPKAKHELLQSCVEVITGVCQTVGEATADLAATVDDVREQAAKRGLGADVLGLAPDHRPDHAVDQPQPALPAARRPDAVAGAATCRSSASTCTSACGRRTRSSRSSTR